MSDRFSVAYHDASEFETDPPAELTDAGRAMLQEIFVAGGSEWPADVDEVFVEISELASHHGTDAQRRSAAQIRAHLLAGGYLCVEEIDTPGSEPVFGEYNICGLALSEKAYEALGITKKGT